MNSKASPKDKPLCRFCKPNIKVVQKLLELIQKREREQKHHDEHSISQDSTVLLKP